MWCDAGHITVGAGTAFSALPDAPQSAAGREDADVADHLAQRPPREREQCASAVTQSFGKATGAPAPVNEVMDYSRRNQNPP
jgi:hypothetical protein